MFEERVTQGFLTAPGRRLLLFLIALTLPAMLAGPARGAEIVPGEVVVALDSSNGVSKAAVASSVRGDVESLAGLESVALVDLAGPVGVREAVRRLERRSDVAWAEPNYVLKPLALPNDPQLGSLWGLRNAGQNALPYNDAEPLFGRRGMDIGAAGAWNITKGVRRNVAVVDSGIAKRHPELSPNLNRSLSRNFVAKPSLDGPRVVDPKAWGDALGHGTHVAGTIGAAGNNGLGVTGVNWRTRLVALRACGLSDCTSADIAAAFDYAGRKKIKVVNASLGTDGGEPAEEIRIMKRAIAKHPTTLYVVAAGNESMNVDRTPEYPCAYKLDNVLCVAAIGPRGAKTAESNWGRASVDLAAPGQYIQSTYVNRAYPFEEFFLEPPAGWIETPYPWRYESSDHGSGLVFDGHDGGLPVPVARASAGPPQEISLSSLFQCRLSVGLHATLHGAQTLGVEYSIAGGPRVVAPVKLGAADIDPEEGADMIADLARADGHERVRVTVVYEANGTVTPLPEIRIESLEFRCNAPIPPGGSYHNISGTSMASPHAAGVAALVRSVWPRAGRAKLKRILMRSTVPMKNLKGKLVTGGRLHAGRAVHLARCLKAKGKKSKSRRFSGAGP